MNITYYNDSPLFKPARLHIPDQGYIGIRAMELGADLAVVSIQVERGIVLNYSTLTFSRNQHGLDINLGSMDGAFSGVNYVKRGYATFDSGSFLVGDLNKYIEDTKQGEPEAKASDFYLGQEVIAFNHIMDGLVGRVVTLDKLGDVTFALLAIPLQNEKGFVVPNAYVMMRVEVSDVYDAAYYMADCGDVVYMDKTDYLQGGNTSE